MMTAVGHDIPPHAIGLRLDHYLASLDGMPTRSQIKAAIRRGDVLVNGVPPKVSYTLQSGDSLSITLTPPPLPNTNPENIPLNILYEDPCLIIIDKPSGMVVHPAVGHPSGTLVNALLAHCGDSLRQAAADDERPGIVHRIDKDTSGLLVVAKTLPTHEKLAKQFAVHSVERAYLALCHAPALPDTCTFDTFHGRHPTDRKKFTARLTQGRRAVTHVTVRERFRDHAALVECRLETGRTHQIRVHLSENHAPILADPLYGGRLTSQCRIIQRVALHAHTLGFVHPDGSWRFFTSPPPDDFQRALNALREGLSWR